MKDWTEEEVAIWLKSNVRLSDELVSKFEGVDGFTLVRCSKAALIQDFELSAGYCTRLMLRREHYLEKERMGMLTTPESALSDSRDSNSKVSAMKNVNTPSSVVVEPTSTPTTSADADEPVPQGESVHKTSSSSPLGNIHVDSTGVEAPGKKKATTAPFLGEVPVASLKMEQDTVESIVDVETGYGSSYTSATPNPSEVDLPWPPFGHPERQESLYQGSGIGVKDSNLNTERKLTNLLLGSDKGELDSSYYPVLVVNTPAQQLSSTELEERFGFMSSVSWNVVFDCNADSNKMGLCQYVNKRKSIKILSAETLTVETEDVNALREGIDFPEIPVWVFPNGRNDVDVQGMDKMSDMDWMRERSHAVSNTVRFFSHPGVIPPGRAVVLFFLLSYSDIMVMTQLFREFYTSKSFQDLKHFTVIAENQGILHQWIQHLESQSIVSSKDMKDRCLGGVQWQEINTYMLRLLGSCETRLPVLPMAPKGQCDLMKKHQSQWSDISILAKNECENTSMDENNPKFLDFVQEKESQFYQGHGVDWWNFYLSEERLNGGKGYNHVLKRQNYRRISSDVHKVLNSQGKKVPNISMATVFHVAGSGGTTVAKNLLWDLHRNYRCAVVNRVTNDTVNQIVAFHKYGYEERQKPGPVVLLLENLDSETMKPFLMSLEREIRYLGNNGLAFVLIHCKRTSEPHSHQQKEESKSCVCVEHKLTKEENRWFTKKTKDLEQRNVFNEKEFPELLLAFMVMKKECDPEYLKKVVKGILPRVGKEPQKALQNAVNLLKYIAVVQKYNPGFAMPVSACDGFMQSRYRVMSSGRQQTFGPWEKHRQPFLNLLLLENFIQDIDGCVKGLAIVHPVIATEIVEQLGELFQQKPADMILELLEKSTILDTLSYSKGYIQKVCRDLMVRRLKKEYGDDRETDFAPFIEDVYAEDKAKAFKIMEVGIKKFRDPFIAQQKARLHCKREGDFDNAEQAINIALGIVSNNSYFWDTKGIILREKMTQYERREEQEVISDCEMKELLDTFSESCTAFQNAQKAMEENKGNRNYAGFEGEITTIAKFLEIVQKRVRPFCFRNKGFETLRRYLMTEYIPPDLTLPSLLEFSDTMKSLSERVDEVLGRFTDYLAHCKPQGFGGASYRNYDDKLEKVYTARHRFFALSSPQLEDERVHAQYPVETAYAMRRSDVKRMNAEGYQHIFDMASKNNVADLKQVQSLLRQNLSSPSLFDIRNFVFTLFALSVYPNEGIDESEARKSVNILKMMEEKDDGFYGLFFEMLLNWPNGTPREGSPPIGETIRQLNARWTGRYHNKVYAESRHNLPRRSRIRQTYSPMKPATEFYLGVQNKKSRFVHRNSFGRITYNTWKEVSTKKTLRRLDGVLDSKHFVLYNPDGEEPVKIPLSLPINGLPSQEPVQFYLGFSFAGPLAYDVVYKDNRENPFITQASSTNYPSYVNEIDDIDEGLEGYDF
ncbi:sterile alpha motif domain-containing protein 9-like [Strongylocentrotus purpuratus]|uniref:SAM domain-containing protein n=1 Tax=Strongylocentrotus purpuratus TaxID=7668 RepID=A0A7M7PFK7_STRPU|nr:sterile alpha motif domain-containing protein 9-like [Strongylocentrotus purpuratus]